MARCTVPAGIQTARRGGSRHRACSSSIVMLPAAEKVADDEDGYAGRNRVRPSRRQSRLPVYQSYPHRNHHPGQFPLSVRYLIFKVLIMVMRHFPFSNNARQFSVSLDIAMNTLRRPPLWLLTLLIMFPQLVETIYSPALPESPRLIT